MITLIWAFEGEQARLSNQEMKRVYLVHEGLPRQMRD